MRFPTFKLMSTQGYFATNEPPILGSSSNAVVSSQLSKQENINQDDEVSHLQLPEAEFSSVNKILQPSWCGYNDINPW